MKKIYALFLGLLMTFTMASCKENKTENPIVTPTENMPSQTEGNNNQNNNNQNNNNNNENVKYLEGTDAAKMLLAQYRLNPEALSGSVGIFNGDQVFSSLADKIRKSRKNSKYPDHEEVEITDTTVEWKNVEKDDSNAMKYFLNISGNVEFSASLAADMIKYVKKNIRVVNCWVQFGDEKYLLLVDENSETLIQILYDYTRICRRYIDEDGNEVYELYNESSIHQSRMKYIENTLVEYFHSSKDSDFHHHFMADNRKGYWDVFGDLAGEEYTATVIKDDIVYDYIGSYGKEVVYSLDIVSNDRKNDVMSVNGNTFTLYGHVFDGIDKFVVDIESEDDIEETVDGVGGNGKIDYHLGCYVAKNSSDVKIHLSNGKVIDTFEVKDGIYYYGTIISVYGRTDYHDDGYHHIYTMNFGVLGHTFEERYEKLKAFLDENNITCRYDLDEIAENVTIAYEEIMSSVKYRMWNDVIVDSEAAADVAAAKEYDKFNYYSELFEEVKDIKIINFEDQDEINANLSFAKVTNTTQNEVSLNEGVVTVKDFNLSVTENVLLDKNETYSIKFGLINVENQFNEIVINMPLDQKAYNGEEVYTINYNGTFNLPECGFGEFVLAAYLSTSDGIRISELSYVKVNDFERIQTKTENHLTTTFKTEEGYLYILVERNPDIYLNYTIYDYISYEELLKVMGSSANQYGMVPEEAKIEILLGEEYLPFEEKIVTSNYRLLYKFYSKSGYVDGYVYMNLTVNVIELEYTSTEMMTLDALKDLFLEHITLNETSKLEMYNLENDEYVAFDETLDLVTGKYRYSYIAKEIVGENEVEYAAYAYLDLTLPAPEVEEEIVEEEEEDFGGFGDLFQ